MGKDTIRKKDGIFLFKDLTNVLQYDILSIYKGGAF